MSVTVVDDNTVRAWLDDSCDVRRKCNPDVNFWCDIHAKERAEYDGMAELERVANATRHGSELAVYKTALDDVRAMVARSVRPYDTSLTIESALEQLQSVFPLTHAATWYDFEIRARSLHGDGPRFTVIMFHVDGAGRRWQERRWQSSTLAGCVTQCLAWRAATPAEL